jgi:hypothetical protein
MGLDMYLEKRTYVKRWEWKTEEGLPQFDVTVKFGGKDYPQIKTERVSGLVEEVGYWRKFNALHQWFVDECGDGVDECQPIYVPSEKLVELLDVCKRIKADHSLASELLPTQDGFFFGSVEYGQYYFEDIDQTIEILEGEVPFDGGSYTYQASW